MDLCLTISYDPTCYQGGDVPLDTDKIRLLQVAEEGREERQCIDESISSRKHAQGTH